MRPLLVLLSAAILVAACDSASTPTTAPPGAPPTTIVDDTCGLLASDTADYLESLVTVLDETTLDEIRDREAWPEALVALQQQGDDLDARAEVMRCDPAAIQTAAFETADIDPQSELGRYLIGLFGRD